MGPNLATIRKWLVTVKVVKETPTRSLQTVTLEVAKEPLMAESDLNKARKKRYPMETGGQARLSLRVAKAEGAKGDLAWLQKAVVKKYPSTFGGTSKHA